VSDCESVGVEYNQYFLGWGENDGGHSWGYTWMTRTVVHLHPLLIRQECRRSVGENRIL